MDVLFEEGIEDPNFQSSCIEETTKLTNVTVENGSIVESSVKNSVKFENIEPCNSNNQIGKKLIKYRHRNSKVIRDQVKSLFDKFDSNGDGFLDVYELHNLISKRENVDIPKEVAQIIIKEYDINQDKKLTFNEMVEMMKEESSILKKITQNYKNKFNNNEKLNIKIPLALILISFVQVIFFWIESRYNCRLYSVFRFSICKINDLWRLFTYMFVHADSTHLIMNVVFQLTLALPLETFESWWRIVLIYMCGVYVGAIGHSIQPFENPRGLVGASAGVFALLTANFTFMTINWTENLSRVYKSQLAIIISFTLLSTFLSGSEDVSHEAHISGAWIGFLLGLFILTKKKNDKTSMKIITWIASIGFIITIIVATGFLIYFNLKFEKLNAQLDHCKENNGRCSKFEEYLNSTSIDKFESNT